MLDDHFVDLVGDFRLGVGRVGLDQGVDLECIVCGAVVVRTELEDE